MVQSSADITASTDNSPTSAGSSQLDHPQSWDLSDLYQGFNDPKLAEDLAELQKTAAKFRQNYRDKVSQLTPVAVADCLQQLEVLGEKSGYLYAFPSLVFSADTRNTEAQQFLDKVKAALTGIDNQLLFFDLELQDLDEVNINIVQMEEAPIIELDKDGVVAD